MQNRTWLTRILVCVLVGALAGAVQAAPVTIGSNTDLALWLRADTVTGISNGQTFGGTSAQMIWADYATGTVGDGTSQDAVLSDGGPTYRTNQINGLPTVDFGGAGAFKSVLPLGISGPGAPLTTFVVANRQASGGDTNQRVLQVGGNANGAGVGFDVKSAGFRYNNGNSLFSDANEKMAGNDVYHLAVWSMNNTHTYGGATAPDYWFDGTTGTLNASTNPGNTTTIVDAGYTLGRGTSNTGGNSDWYAGDVAEVLVYKRELTPLERNDVGYYLQEKYGLSAGYTSAATEAYFDDLDPGDSNWKTGGNWDISANPNASQDAYIGNGLTAQVTQAGEVAQNLTVGHTQATLAGAGALNVTGGDLTTGALTLGQGANDGTYTQSGGAVTVGNSLNFGPATSSVTMTGGTLEITGNITGALGTVDVRNAAGTLTLIENGVAGNGGTILVGGGATLRLHSDVNVNWGQNIIVPDLSGGTDIYVDPKTSVANVTHTLGNMTFQGGRDWRIYNTNPADNHTVVLNNVTLIGDDTRKGNAHVVIAGDILVGSGAPRLFLDEGTTTVQGNANLGSFRVGNAAGSDGVAVYNAPGKTLTNTGTFFVGNNGTGELTVEDGTITVANSLRVGAGEANTNAGFGTLIFRQGVIDINGGGMYIAGQDAAANESDTTGDVVMGTAGGTLTGAQLFTRGANLEVGRGGTGTFTQESGTVTVETNNLVLAQAAASAGTYTINGGRLNVGDAADGASNTDLNFNAGTGIFHHNGGDVVVERDVRLGANTAATSNSTYNMDAGTGSLAIGRYLNVGEDRTGVFNYRSGTFSVGNTIYVGGDSASGTTANPNAHGTINIDPDGTDPTGGTLTFTTKQLEVGRHNIGIVNQYGATVDVASGNVVLGQLGNSDGTYTLNAGVLDIENQLRVGNTGKGRFVQNGGTVNVGTILDLANVAGANSNGTYTMNGGILNAGDRVTSDIKIGNGNHVGATALMEIIDGTVNVSGGIRIADSGANSSGTLTIGRAAMDTNPQVNVTANLENGDDGTGTVNMYSGTITMTGNNNWIIGQTSTGVAEFNMYGGLVDFVSDPDISSNGILKANSGDGVVNMTGGTLRFRDIEGANNAAGSTVYNFNGGDVIISDHLDYRNLGTDTVSLAGATLDLTSGDIHFGDRSGTNVFSFTGGTLKDVNVFYGNLTQQDTAAPSLLRIGADATIDTMTITGAYDQQGGALEIEIGGTAGPGIDPDGWDVLIVNGAATLDGELALVLLGGFAPGEGVGFDVLTATGITLGPDFVLDQSQAGLPVGWWQYEVVTGPAGETLRLTAVPEPATLALLSLAACGLGGYVRRRRKA